MAITITLFSIGLLWRIIGKISSNETSKKQYYDELTKETMINLYKTEKGKEIIDRIINK